MVHRDLKPGNVSIGKPGAKLVDFGLATRPKDSVVDILGQSVENGFGKTGVVRMTERCQALGSRQGDSPFKYWRPGSHHYLVAFFASLRDTSFIVTP